MSKPIVTGFRALLVVYAVGLIVVLTGPFQGVERNFGIEDKSAHALAFYVLTLVAIYGLPQLRKLEVALLAICVGGLMEIVQHFTGREFSFSDAFANSVGVIMAVLPLYVVDIRRAGQGPERRKGLPVRFWNRNDS